MCNAHTKRMMQIMKGCCMKIYAVKKGRTPGIYQTWAECKEQVQGYSGAAFKAFEDAAAAEEYLKPEEQPPIKENLPFAYIDGTFSKKAGCYGWGGFINDGKQCHIIQGKGNSPEYLPERNIAGELIGALQVPFTCQRLGIKEINLYCDYAGIENYVNGNWKAKTPLAKYYAGMMDLLMDDTAIHFIHVDGHTGIEGNELADILAKDAIGAKLRKKDIAAIETLRNSTGSRGKTGN